MNNKIRDTIFFLICLCLIFNNIPKLLQMRFIGGPLGNKLAFYPVFAGMLYTAWCEWKRGGVLVGKREFLKYALAYLGVTYLSLIIGLITYPYWNVVLSGPVEQIEKLPKVLAFLNAHGFNPDIKFMLGGWIVVRQIKDVLMVLFYGFGTAYMFYCWYRDDYKRGLNIASKGFVVSAIIFSLYSIIDAFYLAGSGWAKGILVQINPLLHPIVTNNGWWPPLLWKGQLRSVFSEPSHVGNFLGVVMPLLLFAFMQYSKKSVLLICGVLTYLLSFFMVLTKARSAYAMYFGIIFLFVLLILISRKFAWKKLATILLVCIVGFYSGVGFLDNIAVTASKKQAVTASKLLEDNLFSLNTIDKRSNGARYALIKANFRIAADHPVLGVGRGLAQCYMLDKYTEAEKANREVADWIKKAKKYGIFASGQGQSNAMNEWVTQFSETGLAGVLVFLAPFIFVLYELGGQYLISPQMDIGFLITAIVSSLVAGCNGSLNLIYGIWILLGLCFAMCFSKGRDAKELNERT